MDDDKFFEFVRMGAMPGWRMKADPLGGEPFPIFDRRKAGYEVPTPKPRRPALGRILKEAKKAGAAVVVEGDKLTLKFGAAESCTETNPWDVEAERLRRQRGAA